MSLAPGGFGAMFRAVVIRAVFWDIDGTLIRTGGAGIKAFEQTFETAFGLKEATAGLKFCGRTDTSLVRECFAQHRIDPAKENFRLFFETYPRLLEQYLHELPGGVCEGVETYLERLRGLPEPPLMGLLTGNVRRGAELKLRHYQLWDHFTTGAFADDHEDRNCIAGIARDRAQEALGRKLAGEEILVIGDTPLDIACAQSIGARVLAVATGNFKREELASAGATLAVENLQMEDPAIFHGGTGVG